MRLLKQWVVKTVGLVDETPKNKIGILEQATSLGGSTSLRGFLGEPGLGLARGKTPITLEPS